MQLSLISFIFLVIAPLAPSIVQATPTPEPAPAPEPWRQPADRPIYVDAPYYNDRTRYKTLGNEGPLKHNGNGNALVATASPKSAKGSSKNSRPTVKVTKNGVYDREEQKMKTTACYKQGFASEWKKFIDAPAWPFVGAGPHAAGLCGHCWEISYKNRTYPIILVDHAENWVISGTAFNSLTGNTKKSGAINAHVRKVHQDRCESAPYGGY